jgi:hypothetical protein
MSDEISPNSSYILIYTIMYQIFIYIITYVYNLIKHMYTWM